MCNKLVQKKGSTLLIVMALVALLTLIATMAADRATLDVELSYNQLNSEKAFYAADAGIKHAVVVLNDSVNWRTGFVNMSIGGALYSVAVVDSATIPALIDTVILRSTAAAFDAVANVEAKVIPAYDRPFQYAAFGDDSLIMKNTACTDSFNSDSGSYASTQLNEGGDIGSNGIIDLSNTTDVYGDASTATDGGITLDGSAVITGDTTSTAPAQDMTIIPDSDFSWAQSNSMAPSGFSGNFLYDPTTYSLALNNTYDTLVLSSGVYYFSSISLSQDASLQIAPGAEVTIYMTGNLALGQNASVNPYGSTSSLQIYSTGTELNLGQHTEFHGAFWGPNTAISIEQNTDVYGSMIGESIFLANSACVHYDRSLSKITTSTVKGMEIIAWREQ